MQYRILSNGVELPLIGYGTFQIRDEAQCERCVAEALAAGYRLFDTAASYGNEAAVGAALRGSGLPREAWFVTTKLWVQDAGYDSALWAFDRSRKNLGLDYIDLYLIHQPFGDYYGAWRAMERLYREGAVRAIGVSNFPPERLVDLCMNQELRPMVNPIEIHPFYQQGEALRVMEDWGVVPQAWGPFPRRRRIFSTTRHCPKSRTGTAKPRPRSFSAGTSSGIFLPSPSRSTRTGWRRTWTSLTLH